jgi:hypothetical protein
VNRTPVYYLVNPWHQQQPCVDLLHRHVQHQEGGDDRLQRGRQEQPGDLHGRTEERTGGGTKVQGKDRGSTGCGIVT